MKKLLIILLMGLLLVSCGSNEKTNESVKEVDKPEITYKTIDPKQAKENMDNDESILLLDVRTQEEFDIGHIVGAELLTLDLIKDSIEGIYTDKSQTIYVYCRSGNRSKTASNIMIELGYENVYDLGGILSWPYDTE